jgi:glucose dehydrogenase
MNNVQLPYVYQVKYLGLHLDRKLTWHHHIFTKRKQLGLTLTKMYLLLGRSSQLSLPNKLLLYKTILKPIWTYGIQLWGTASTSNIEILLGNGIVLITGFIVQL